ncbi:MAG TPA: tetratricopeptide repeat protein [Sphingomicrobium sp.]|nr:tetratricopeptide repeat protein [Sphingomicrobium sp.]
MGARPQEQQTPASSSQDEKASAETRAAEESSSSDTRIDLSPPKDDQKNHPLSGAAVSAAAGPSGVQELHPWDPHRAAKDVEVADYYLKRKNYRAAIWRYKEALIYKPNDAVAEFRLAECLEKTANPAEAETHYQEYLKILPHGPFAADAQKALERLKSP